MVCESRGGRSHVFRLWLPSFIILENPTLVQTPKPHIQPKITSCLNLIFYLIRPRRLLLVCYCRKWKVAPDLGPVFQNVLTPAPKKNATSSCCNLRIKLFLLIRLCMLLLTGNSWPNQLLLEQAVRSDSKKLPRGSRSGFLYSLRHFGQFSHSSIKTHHNSIHKPTFSEIMTELTFNFFR